LLILLLLQLLLSAALAVRLLEAFGGQLGVGNGVPVELGLNLGLGRVVLFLSKRRAQASLVLLVGISREILTGLRRSQVGV